MNSPGTTALDRAVATGAARGILPAGTTLPADKGRPWPVVLLTALGAWLAAIPLLGVVGLLLGDLLSRSIGPYFVGVLMLMAAITVLRSREIPVFVEQLALPALLVGGGALAFGLMRDLPDRLGAGVLAVIAMAVATAIHHPWLRVLLGAAAAGLCMVMLTPDGMFSHGKSSMLPLWTAIHGGLMLMVLAGVLQARVVHSGLRMRWLAVLESVGAGWVLALLAALSFWSGMTFMVGASMGWAGEIAGSGPSRTLGPDHLLMQACSAVLGSLGLLLACRRWPTLRQPAAVAVGLVWAAICWFLPALGATLMLLAATATSHRWRLAGAAAVACAWIVGSFYYQLQWPLAHKAAVLTAAGAMLAAIAWLSRLPETVTASPDKPQPQPWAAAFMVLAALLTLGMANVAIWQKQELIAKGNKVFVALAPLDPRSLMQGDFMRLNYNVPTLTHEAQRGIGLMDRPHAIAKRDARGVATLLRVASASDPLADGEMRIELTPKDGRWILVSDAWFFREGDGRRWEAAKFGEFRVMPDGKALLVGLANAQLQTIPIE